MAKHRERGRREHLGWWLPVIGVGIGVAVALGCICGFVVRVG